ncbi:hypothetical protein JW711_00365 [Candidatus Woesearchaeota archaeon]|nr:hypothetical protein [Candidatus Woesearchaeota archaeon]
MKNSKKGQAALEFLTTYGWAFLVILIMIGALAYFGVLNPKNFLPSRCTFSPEVDCLEAQIQTTNPMLSFRMRNNVGSTANFTVNATYIGGNVIDATSCTSDFELRAGRVQEVQCNFGAGAAFPAGDKAKFEVTVNYKKVDGAYWTPVKGEIYGTVNG